jgi:hypothetical protein
MGWREDWQNGGRDRWAAKIKARFGMTPKQYMKWRKAQERFRPKLPYDGSAICEIDGFDKLIYCMVSTSMGWVCLDRHYKRIGIGGHYTDGDGLTRYRHFSADPRQVGGCFALVEGTHCYLYNTCWDSAADYLSRLQRLAALRAEHLGRA